MPTRSSLFADKYWYVLEGKLKTVGVSATRRPLVYRGNCVRRLLEPAHAAPNRVVSPPGAEGQRRIDSFAPWSQ
jgi:hypothetical protein